MLAAVPFSPRCCFSGDLGLAGKRAGVIQGCLLWDAGVRLGQAMALMGSAPNFFYGKGTGSVREP